MAYQGFIESPGKQPSLATRLTEAVGKGVQGASQAYSEHIREKRENEALKQITGKDFSGLSPEMKKMYAKQLLGSSGSQNKGREKLHTAAPNILKRISLPHLSNPEAYDALLTEAEKYTDMGYLPDQALSMALKSSNNQSERTNSKKKRSFVDRVLGNSESSPSSSFMDEEHQNPMHTMFDPESGERHYGIASTAKKYPVETFSSIPIENVIKPLESLSSINPLDMAARVLQGKSIFQTPISDKLEEISGINKLPQQAKEDLDVLNVATLFIPLGGILKALGVSKFNPFWKSAKTMASSEGITVEKAAEKIFSDATKEGINAEKILAGDAEEVQKLNTLAGRVTEGAPENATKLRVSRLSPESKIYNRGEQEKILADQLKEHPRYAKEIALDAEQRNSRLEKQVGPQALETRKVRIARAESELPKAQEAYQRAVGRVRALEEELVHMAPQEAERAKKLLEAAKNELRDSESYLKNMMSNARTGKSWKEGSEQMRKAAQDKMLDIERRIADGEEIALSKADYNPEFARQGKKLAKQKKVPSTRQDDFYNQVHDEYSKEYRKRIEKLNSEIAKPSKSLSDSMLKKQRIKERDTLQKMVDSAEGEKAIHTRKLGLREMEQRKLARERLKSTTRPTEAPGVEKAAKSRMEMAEKVREGMKSRDSREKLAEELVEEAAQDAPKAGEKIRGEKGNLNDALDEVNKSKEKMKSGEGPKTVTQAKGWAERKAAELKEAIDALRKGDLSFFKTKIGQDFAKSAIAQVVSETCEYFDIDLPPSALLSAVMGTSRHGYRAAWNIFFTQISKKIKKGMYKSAIKDMDHQRAMELKGRFPKGIIRDAERELKEAS